MALTRSFSRTALIWWYCATCALLRSRAAASGARLYGPSGLRNLSGPPAEQTVYSRLRDVEDAVRIWQISEDLTGTAFPFLPSSGERRVSG